MTTKTKEIREIARQRFTEDEIADMEHEAEVEVLELTLAELRKTLGITQQELAQIAEMSQSELSKTERRTDHRVSTLRRIVHALGGQLEIVARFGDKRVRLLET